MRGIHRWTVNSPHKGPVTRKMFPFDDVIMDDSVCKGSDAAQYVIILLVYVEYVTKSRLIYFNLVLNVVQWWKYSGEVTDMNCHKQVTDESLSMEYFEGRMGDNCSGGNSSEPYWPASGPFGLLWWMMTYKEMSSAYVCWNVLIFGHS